MSLDLGRSMKILFDMYFSLKSTCIFHYIHPLSPMITELDLSCCELFSKFKGFPERGASFLSLYMILINLQDTGLTISKTETFKLSRFFVSLSMDNPLSQIVLVTCCRVKSDVSTWRDHRKKFLLPFWLSKLCSQMSSEFILINWMNMFGCCKGGRFS